MNSRMFCAYAVLAISIAGSGSRAHAERPLGAVDPGPRPGAVNAGGAVPGVNARYFANLRSAFNEVYSIAGDLEPGVGLGPRFNGTSCGGCHAYPAPGGSSPKRNPQLAMAAAYGAANVIPVFLKLDGPVRVARVITRVGPAGLGEVLPLFTVTGRADAYHCAVEQPDFTDTAKLSFRIPTPVFGAGLIDNIPDAEILANRETKAMAKAALGINGRPNIGLAGAVGKFGWKAQQHSLTRFAEEAYETEMGVPDRTSGYRRTSLSTTCYTLYEAALDDPHFSSSYGEGQDSAVLLFTEFMRFLDAPSPVRKFPGGVGGSIANGRRLFDRIGCNLCHSPSLRTGNQSNLPALNGREVPLYSDLLLHRMGPKLADGIVQGSAGSEEFRTAPLWGVGQRVFFLHDGRTTDLIVAIQDHASNGEQFHSEATGVIDAFRRLNAAEQQDILNFLRSL